MGLGGSIASTVKNKLSGYGGNLVSNLAGAAKSPKRTGSVNHDVEGLIEKNQFLDNNNVVYYPLDIGTDANGHYLQFFIRKQSNLKMTFKGNDTSEASEGIEPETVLTYSVSTKKTRGVVVGSKTVKTKISKGDNGYTLPKNPWSTFPGKSWSTGTYIIGIVEEGDEMYALQKQGTFFLADTVNERKKTRKYGKKTYNIKIPKGHTYNRIFILEQSQIEKQISTSSSASKEKPNLVGETPENEVKVGITSKYPSLRMESSIALFLPGGIKNETKPEWGETGTRLSYEAQATLAVVNKGLTAGLQAGGKATEMAMKEKLIPNLMDRAGAKYGMAYTDRMQVFFKNMGKRSFSYSFKFMPKSRAESIRVDDIVKMFRFYGSPSYLNSKSVQGDNEGMGTGGTERGSSGGYAIMRQPQIFEIVYMYKDKRNEYLNRISHCVLDSVSITYNGDNNKFFNPSEDKKSGSPAPVETQIDLSFKEIEIITKDKIDQGY